MNYVSADTSSTISTTQNRQALWTAISNFNNALQGIIDRIHSGAETNIETRIRDIDIASSLLSINSGIRSMSEQFLFSNDITKNEYDSIFSASAEADLSLKQFLTNAGTGVYNTGFFGWISDKFSSIISLYKDILFGLAKGIESGLSTLSQYAQAPLDILKTLQNNLPLI